MSNSYPPHVVLAYSLMLTHIYYNHISEDGAVKYVNILGAATFKARRSIWIALWFSPQVGQFWLWLCYMPRDGLTIALSEVKSRKGKGDISIQSRLIVIHPQLGFDEHLDEWQKWSLVSCEQWPKVWIVKCVLSPWKREEGLGCNTFRRQTLLIYSWYSYNV